MPEMNGMELLQAIEHAQGNRPFVITMSGYSLYTPNQLYTEGSAGFIPKPLKYQQIVELIENYVLLVADQRAAEEEDKAAS
jgi:DNA-binding NtrC family response regulator